VILSPTSTPIKLPILQAFKDIFGKIRRLYFFRLLAKCELGVKMNFFSRVTSLTREGYLLLKKIEKSFY